MKRYCIKPVIILLMLILGLAGCSQKAETYQLSYNYEKGDKFVYQVDMSGDMTVGTGENKHGGNFGFGLVMSQEVVDIDDKGIYTVNATLEQFKMSMDVDGQKIEMPTMFDQLSFKMKMDKYGKTYSVEGFDDLLTMGMEAPIDMNQILDNSKPSLPDHPVKVGDSWENTVEIPFPGVQEPIKANIVMKLEGIEEVNGQDAAKVSSKVSLPLDMKYNLKDTMQGMEQPVPAPQGQEMPDMIVEMSGYENVDMVSYITLDKGITLSSRGTFEMEMTVKTGTPGENTEETVNMNATINMELKE